ncbi:PREDICTED: kelch-like protein 8 [Populus euphratica]|uniref:Kelch-like protein 8 n=1 Tax=Populus euphratica TaxID=75702 RepID=A0AAJ6UEF2_POPEU|nr:PREDICTED: kelch-like protein 8 [Populus euphratica]
MGAGRKTRTFHLKEKSVTQTSVNSSITARNLRKSDLAGVIFGCKNNTIRECFSKQLFGIPGSHYPYVKKIDPGLPLFLFNYSDRKLHGIFEATSHGGWNIDPNAWTEDGSGITPYSAQVRIRVQMQCQPLVEDQFSPIIAENYYRPNLFWFELDQDQTNKFISKFSSSLVIASTKDMHNWNYLPCDPNVRQENDYMDKFNDCKESTTTSSLSLKPWSALFKFETCPDTRAMTEKENAESSNVNLTNLDTSIADHIGVETCIDSTIKKKSLSALFTKSTGPGASKMTAEDNNESSDASVGNVENLDAKKLSITTCMATAFPEKSWSTWYESENRSDAREVMAVGSDGENSEVDSQERKNSEMESLYLHSVLAKLSMELEDLKSSQSSQVQKISYLEHELAQSRNEIKLLKDRCKMLEYVSFPAMGHLAEDGSELEEFNSCSDELILIGGFDGSSWLLGLDFYSPSQDQMESLTSMSAIRRYASTGRLNGEIYIFGGANDDVWYDTVESYNLLIKQWSSRPSLKRRKGSVASVSLEDKMLAVGGGDGVECFSEVEIFDLNVGRWIPTQSMRNKRFAAAAAEINGMLYVAGGYNGEEYLKSVERYDLREHKWARLDSMTTKRGSLSLVAMNEKLYALGGYDGDRMVSTVEVFDPRAGLWREAESMNSSRGYFGDVAMGDSIYVIGGLNNDNQILDTVECFREGHGWQEGYSKAIGKRCFLSAVVV